MRLDDRGRPSVQAEERVWDIWRSWSTNEDCQDQVIAAGGLIWEVPVQPMPVTREDELSVRRIPDEPDPYPDIRVRDYRGEITGGELEALNLSPASMTREQALAAASQNVHSEHVCRGARITPSKRWEGYIGVGSHLQIVATCDTQAEALLVATAHLWRSWLDRVEEIRAARGQDLSWGTPIPAPSLEDEDPQAAYKSGR